MEDIDKNGVDSFGEYETGAVDKLINEASAAIDDGDYRAALDGFRSALKLARQYFGDSAELTELENSIYEINKLLQD